VTLSQQAELAAISDTEAGDARFLNKLLQIAFGVEVLAVSSITGQSKQGHQNLRVKEDMKKTSKRSLLDVFFLIGYLQKVIAGKIFVVVEVVDHPCLWPQNRQIFIVRLSEVNQKKQKLQNS
jgi:hypothetical protein